MAEGWGWLDCLQRQRTLLLVCDPLHTNTHTNTHTHTHTHTYSTQIPCVTLPTNHPSPPGSLQAGWTLNSMAATFLQIEEGRRGGTNNLHFCFHSLCFLFGFINCSLFAHAVFSTLVLLLLMSSSP